jgi:hypothetical protein
MHAVTVVRMHVVTKGQSSTASVAFYEQLFIILLASDLPLGATKWNLPSLHVITADYCLSAEVKILGVEGE